MFTYLKMKNFKGFKETIIDFESKKEEFKHIVCIYGANGCGKSTITEAFMLLRKTMNSMYVKDVLLKLLNNKITPPDDIPIKTEMMLEIIKEHLMSDTVEKIISDYKMIDSSDPMILEFGFIINGSAGSYLMEFSDTSLIRERLEYKVLKNRGCCFDIENGKIEINAKIFDSTEFLEEIKRQIQMYWGKHSVLSILRHEIDDKAEDYINSNISENLKSVINAFGGISIKANARNEEYFEAGSILANLGEGSVDKADEKELDQTENLVDIYLKTLFDDINRAYYKRKEKNGKLYYSLFLNKTVNDRDFDIAFKFESSGTEEMLRLLPYFMLAIKGKCVVIDEFGKGIHDLMAARLLRAVAKDIQTGQLILTTHNTLIMDHSDIRPEALYFIISNAKDKCVKCVTDIEERLHPNYNYRNRYFSNALYSDGLPKESEIDFKQLAEVYVKG